MQLSKLFLITVVLSSTVFAYDVKVSGTIEKTIKVPTKSGLYQNEAPRRIKFLKINLSKRALDGLKIRAKSVYQTPTLF